MNEAMISTWIKDEFESNKDVIEDLSAAQVSLLLENEQFVMVYVCKYNEKLNIMCGKKNSIAIIMFERNFTKN